MANVKVLAEKVTDKQTDGQTVRPITICPQSIDVGAIKIRLVKI